VEAAPTTCYRIWTMQTDAGAAALDIRMAVAGPTITAIHPSTHKTALAHATLSRSLLENHVTAPSLLHKLGKAC
jgi:hypothetical protein